MGDSRRRQHPGLDGRVPQEADRALFVISNAYLDAHFSSWERRAAQWAAASKRPNFFLPVFVENCEPPLLLAPFKRCVLYGLGEGYARTAWQYI